MRTSVLFIIIAALAAGVLVGCGGGEEAAAPAGYAPDQRVEAYNYVHGGYVGQAVVTTDDEGNIDVTLDEAFMPHTLAAVDIESDEWTEANTATYQVRGETNYVARWVSYNGTNYVGNTVGTTLVYVPADDGGNPATDVNQDNLEMTIIRNEANMAAWFDNIADGGFAIYTELGGEAMPVTESPYGGLTKRNSSYWDFGLGWQGNMEEIESAAEEYGVGYALEDMSRDPDENTWSLADATTGATASDFKDYFALIQMAVARLEMQ
jgi:hypothetical protein